MKTKILLAIMMAVLVGTTRPSYATKHVITQINLTFNPSYIPDVYVGDTMKWVWTSGYHTTTSTSVPFGAATWDAILSISSQTYEYVVTQPGTYHYQCSFHYSSGMVGSFAASILPPPVATISGMLTYDNSSVEGMSNSYVTFFDSNNASVGIVPTSSNGSFSGSGFADGVYTLQASSNIPWGGANALDALTALKEFVSLIQLSPFRHYAADVDNSTVVNSLDALYISKRFVGLITSFPAGDWHFSTATVTVSGAGTYTQNLQGICIGDCDGSYTFAAKTAPGLTATYAENQNIRAGSDVLVPIKATGDMELGAISMILDYPAENLTISDVICNSPDGHLEFLAKNGELRIAWYSLNPMELHNNDVMFWIRVQSKEGIPAGTNIKFDVNAGSMLGNADAKPVQSATVSIPTLKTTTSATNHVILQTNLTFVPSLLTGVNVGDTVTWVWSSGTHTTTSTTIPAGAASWDAMLTSTSTSFSYHVTVAGTFDYECSIHSSMGMTGSFVVSPATGIQNITPSSSENPLEVYPNPASDFASLTIRPVSPGNLDIRLYDALGSLVYSESVFCNASSLNKSINISGLKPGIYLVRITGMKDFSETRRIVKQ